MPTDPQQRAQIRAWELLATEVITPAGRLGMIGRLKALNLQPMADHLGAKYHWSAYEERRAERVLRTALPDLATAVARSPHLVGGAFTRADLTVAALLSPVLGLPPDDLFAIDPGMRPMFGTPFSEDAALAPLRAWRDDTYRRHRGGRVVPAAA